MMMLLTTLPTTLPPILLTTHDLTTQTPDLTRILVVGTTTGTALATMASITTPTGIGSNFPALPPPLLQQRVASLVQRVASPAQRVASPEEAEERAVRVAPTATTTKMTMMTMITLMVEDMDTPEDQEEE